MLQLKNLCFFNSFFFFSSKKSQEFLPAILPLCNRTSYLVLICMENAPLLNLIMSKGETVLARSCMFFKWSQEFFKRFLLEVPHAQNMSSYSIQHSTESKTFLKTSFIYLKYKIWLMMQDAVQSIHQILLPSGREKMQTSQKHRFQSSSENGWIDNIQHRKNARNLKSVSRAKLVDYQRVIQIFRARASRANFNSNFHQVMRVKAVRKISFMWIFQSHVVYRQNQKIWHSFKG